MARRALIFAVVCALLGAVIWRVQDRVARGALYPWVEALVFPANPYDGVYMADVAAIDPETELGRLVDLTLAEGLALPSIEIAHFRARSFGGLYSGPINFGGTMEVCLKEDRIILTGKDQPTGYCVRHDAWGTGSTYRIEEDGARIVCEDCPPEPTWPTVYIRVSDLSR